VKPSPDEVRTDAEGNFRVLTDVPAVVIRKPGYQSQRVRVSGDSQLKITLRRIESTSRCKLKVMTRLQDQDRERRGLCRHLVLPPDEAAVRETHTKSGAPATQPGTGPRRSRAWFRWHCQQFSGRGPTPLQLLSLRFVYLGVFSLTGPIQARARNLSPQAIPSVQRGWKTLRDPEASIVDRGRCLGKVRDGNYRPGWTSFGLPVALPLG
jgi:hypothetical protein